jgi:hypothetical protein
MTLSEEMLKQEEDKEEELAPIGNYDNKYQ